MDHVKEIEILIGKYSKSQFKLIQDILKEYSLKHEISIKEIKHQLDKANSRYAKKIVGIIDGKEISKSNLISQFKKIIKKIFKILKLNNDLTSEECQFIYEYIEYTILGDIYN